MNVGFAKLQMNAALGLSEAAFPRTLEALDGFGVRLWIAGVMLSSGSSPP